MDLQSEPNTEGKDSEKKKSENYFVNRHKKTVNWSLTELYILNEIKTSLSWTLFVTHNYQDPWTLHENAYTRDLALECYSPTKHLITTSIVYYPQITNNILYWRQLKHNWRCLYTRGMILHLYDMYTQTSNIKE